MAWHIDNCLHLKALIELITIRELENYQLAGNPNILPVGPVHPVRKRLFLAIHTMLGFVYCFMQ